MFLNALMGLTELFYIVLKFALSISSGSIVADYVDLVFLGDNALFLLMAHPTSSDNFHNI